MNKKQFADEMTKSGITVACCMAKAWIKSRQHAERWSPGSAGRRVAYAVYSDSYKAWIEPSVSYASWSDALEARKQDF